MVNIRPSGRWLKILSWLNFCLQNTCLIGVLLSFPALAGFIFLGIYIKWYYYFGCLVFGMISAFFFFSTACCICFGFQLGLEVFSRQKLETYVNLMVKSTPDASIKANVYKIGKRGTEKLTDKKTISVPYPTCFSTYECDELTENRFILSTIQDIQSDVSFKEVMSEELKKIELELSSEGDRREFFFNVNMNNVVREVFVDRGCFSRILKSTRSSIWGILCVVTGFIHPFMVYFTESFSIKRLILNKTLSGENVDFKIEDNVENSSEKSEIVVPSVSKHQKSFSIGGTVNKFKAEETDKLIKQKNVNRIKKKEGVPLMLFTKPPENLEILDNNSWFNTKFQSYKLEYKKDYVLWTVYMSVVIFLLMSLFCTPFVSFPVFGALLVFLICLVIIFIQFGRKNEFSEVDEFV